MNGIHEAGLLCSQRLVAYIVSQELAKASSLLPSNKNRSALVHSLIGSLGLLSSPSVSNHGPGKSTSESYNNKDVLRVVRPRLASVQQLCLYHDRDYVDFILNPSNNGAKLSSQCSYFGLEDDCPPFQGMGEYVQMIAGATLSAAHVLKLNTFDVSICWDGGRHHAQKSRSARFCYVADCILAILSLKKASPLPLLNPAREKARIMYLDLDLHFSDAVSECFYKSAPCNAVSQVLTLSLHHSSPGFYPSTPLADLSDPAGPGFDPFTLSLSLKQGASSKTFERVWAIVSAVKDAYRPDYVVLQCGTDGLAGDPHGVWNWSIGEAKGDMNWCVGEVINKWDAKVLLLDGGDGGGGYDSPNAAGAGHSLLCSFFLSAL
ncbi:hypothetical protein EW145_g6529 [Phellinidium pouzarii]|uniref:histone deacetylase n=1 Tax=Phellinidium pouzarii TaxID=167371 RepID=A0A4V3XBS2_9AGAM|nr:hypothetical protein EW145_g6529 [Phellinidium pouzarii]